MATFTLAGPLGTMIGFILQNEAPLVLQGIFMSITSGTFLYIALTEVVALEFSKVEHKLVKFIGLICGITALSCLLLIKEGD